MKAIVVSDFAQLRGAAKQMVPLLALVDVFMLAVVGEAAMPVTMLCTMVPYLLFSTLATSDEASGWERMRATLPGGRRAAVLGRYASVLLLAAGTAVAAVAFNLAILAVVGAVPGLSSLFGGMSLSLEGVLDLLVCALMGTALAVTFSAVSLPFMFKQGMTGATRTVPLVAMLAFVFAVAFFSGDGAPDMSWLVDLSPALACGMSVALAAVLCAISIPLSLRLHATREL